MNTRPHKTTFDLPIHFLMALNGGFLGAYAIFNRMALFANAQTANLIELMAALIGRNFQEVLLRLGALLIFCLAISLSVPLERKLGRRFQYLTVFAELLLVFLLGYFPEDMDPFLAVYPIFFMAALQWCAFPGADGFGAANIFCTNNTRQTVTALTEYLLDRKTAPEQAQKKAKKARFFGGTLLAFYCGAALGFSVSIHFSIRGIWFLFLPICFVLALLTAGDRN